MAHIEDIIGRLPQLYRDGELVRDVLEVPALQMEILDELSLEVQQAHWFNSAVELDDAAALATILGIQPETWQGLRQFRAWVHALRNAWLRHGTVTQAGLQAFVMEYIRLFQQAVGIIAIRSFAQFNEQFVVNDASFVENPPARKHVRIPAIDGIEPLHQFEIIQTGVDESVVNFLLTGLPTAPEFVPVVANISTGEALIFLGQIPPGQRLWIYSNVEGGVEARLENRDVSNKLYSVSNLEPGTPWEDAQVERPAKSLKLRRGKNDLWFLPIAHFDSQGLDRCLMALADLQLKQGRLDQTHFDSSLFYQEPVITLDAAWIEHEPASFQMHLPAGAMTHGAGEVSDALQDRDRLGSSLNLGINRLRAAGVKASVTLQPFSEMQRQQDFLTDVHPRIFREVGPTGIERIPDVGGLFQKTSFEDSTFR